MQLVTIYTTPFCGYCEAAKRLLTSRGFTYQEVKVGDDPELRAQVSSRVGNYRTVPMIFIGDEFIGGYDQLVALDRAKTLATKIDPPPPEGDPVRAG